MAAMVVPAANLGAAAAALVVAVVLFVLPPPQAAAASASARVSAVATANVRLRMFGAPSVGEDLGQEVLGPLGLGWSKNLSGGATSTMCPASMNATRRAAERAKPISWVTTTIVMPSAASSGMTSSTSLIISGSRAEVGSSKSMSLGSMARARAMAARCCWPPDSSAG